MVEEKIIHQINLNERDFSGCDLHFPFIGNLGARLFRYSSGVPAVRLTNPYGHVTVLPTQGFQVWNAEFFGHQVGMESLVKEPILYGEGTDYLDGNGALLINCGPRAMGCPVAGVDSHPLHGDLPNAMYSDITLEIVQGLLDRYFIRVSGVLNDVAQSGEGFCYSATSSATLYPSSGMIHTSMEITNLHEDPMDYMFLSHVNFLPVLGGRLVYSAPNEGMIIRTQDPVHAPAPDKLKAFRELVRSNPSLLDIINENSVFDPEVVAYYSYLADNEGWAHSIEILPDNYGLVLRHKPDQLPLVVRWMRMVSSETARDSGFPVVNGFGFLPATGKPEGYTAAKVAGEVQVIPSYQKKKVDLMFGVMTPGAASLEEEFINRILRGEL